MQRPTSVTVFGILNICFGAVGILGCLSSFRFLFDRPPGDNPVYEVMYESPTYLAISRGMLLPSLIFSALMLASGIGLLRSKRWAWIAAIVCGVVGIATGLVSTVLNHSYLFRPLMERAATMPGPQKAGLIGGAVGVLLAGIASLIYPILLLALLSRRTVAAYFRSDRSFSPSPVP
ncbi:MAG: hypothetical protein HY721_02275 [Planctomycetes bacterium]|nr:hypothetical protein [Planctomycetota bacterium]